MRFSLGPNRRWDIAGSVVLLGLGAGCIFLSLFIVPKFELIYQDAIPGRALPAITVFIIEDRLFLVLVAFVWPIVGVIMVLRRHRAATWVINLGYFYFLLLIGVTVIALFKPMIGLIME